MRFAAAPVVASSIVCWRDGCACGQCGRGRRGRRGGWCRFEGGVRGEGRGGEIVFGGGMEVVGMDLGGNWALWVFEQRGVVLRCGFGAGGK